MSTIQARSPYTHAANPTKQCWNGFLKTRAQGYCGPQSLGASIKLRTTLAGKLDAVVAAEVGRADCDFACVAHNKCRTFWEVQRFSRLQKGLGL